MRMLYATDYMYVIRVKLYLALFVSLVLVEVHILNNLVVKQA